MRKRPAKERFEEKVSIQDNGCWKWTGYIENGMYGHFWYKGKMTSAHRASYELYKKDIPKGKGMECSVCHTCDNPSCVNPEHLYLGTHYQNMQDAKNRKRLKHKEGEQHTNAKLTKKQVIEIREMYKTNKYSHADIAKRYNVHKDTIGNAVSKRTYSNI